MLDLKGNPFDRKFKKTIGNYYAMPHPVTKQTLGQLTLGRELCGNYSFHEGSFEWPDPEVRCVKEKTHERVRRQKEKN